MMKKICLLMALVALLVACGGSEDSGDDRENNPPTPTVAANTDDAAERVDPPQDENAPDNAAVVNGEPIPYEQLQREVELAQETFQPADLSAFEAEILESMINQVLIDQYAESQGITVDEATVQQEITILEQLAADQEMPLSEIIGYPEDQLETQVRQMLLTQAVQQHVLENVATTVTQIHARHILVKDEALARDLLNQLNNGADFAALAQEYSEDFSTAREGGDLGWISPGTLLQPEVEEVIFQMPVNSRWPEPVVSVLGFHIIESLESVEDQPLDPTERTALSREAFERWLNELRQSAEIVRNIG